MRKPCEPFGETERSGDASLSMIPDKVAVQVSGRCNGVTLAGAHPSADLRHAAAGVRGYLAGSDWVVIRRHSAGSDTATLKLQPMHCPGGP